MEVSRGGGATRNRYIDLVRVVALGAVVLGHWLVIDVAYRRGELSGTNVLGAIPYAPWLTLLFQTLPVFFLAGGYANAASWSAHRDRGGSWPAWLQRRVHGLVRPTTAYVAAATGVVAVLDVVTAGAEALPVAAWLVALHLWFLSVYLVVLALTPLQVALHRRAGLAVAVAAGALAALVDVAVLRWSVEPAGWANYLLVWGCVHQLGVAWQRGDLARRRALPLGTAAAGLVALVALVAWGPYPVSMVGVPGAEVQNTSPPSLALLAFGCTQAGLLVAAESRVSGWLASPARWSRVRAANRLALTVYLWHLVPVVIVALTLYPAGVMPQPAVGSASWWLARLAWVAALAAVLAAVVRAMVPVLAWLVRPTAGTGRPGPAAAVCVVAGTGALAAALARLAVAGFLPDGRLPWLTLGTYAGGSVLVLLAGSRARGSGRVERAGQPRVGDDDGGRTLDQPKRVQ